MEHDKAGSIGAGIGGGIGAFAGSTLEFTAVTTAIIGGAGASLSYLAVYLFQKYQSR